MGRYLSPRYGQVIQVSGYPVLTAVNWSQHRCAICVQYQFSIAPKLARKCEIEHWFPCGADGRAGCGRAVYGHVITKFLGWVDSLSYGALFARVEFRYYRQISEGANKPLRAHHGMETKNKINRNQNWKTNFVKFVSNTLRFIIQKEYSPSSYTNCNIRIPFLPLNFLNCLEVHFFSQTSTWDNMKSYDFCLVEDLKLRNNFAKNK